MPCRDWLPSLLPPPPHPLLLLSQQYKLCLLMYLFLGHDLLYSIFFSQTLDRHGVYPMLRVKAGMVTEEEQTLGILGVWATDMPDMVAFCMWRAAVRAQRLARAVPVVTTTRLPCPHFIPTPFFHATLLPTIHLTSYLSPLPPTIFQACPLTISPPSSLPACNSMTLCPSMSYPHLALLFAVGSPSLPVHWLPCCHAVFGTGRKGPEDRTCLCAFPCLSVPVAALCMRDISSLIKYSGQSDRTFVVDPRWTWLWFCRQTYSCRRGMWTCMGNMTGDNIIHMACFQADMCLGPVEDNSRDVLTRACLHACSQAEDETRRQAGLASFLLPGMACTFSLSLNLLFPLLTTSGRTCVCRVALLCGLLHLAHAMPSIDRQTCIPTPALQV